MNDDNAALIHATASDTPDFGPEPANINAAPEFMSEFRAAEIDTGEGGADDVFSVDDQGLPFADAPDAVEALSKEAFWHVFKTSFALPAMFAPAFAPLAIQEHEIEIGRDASDAIYEILEIYYPAALMPQGEMFARIARAAPFIIAKVMIVRSIVQAMKLSKMEPVNNVAEFKSRRTDDAPEPANTNAVPTQEHGGWMDAEQVAA